MDRALRMIGTCLILGCWGTCLLGGISAVLGLWVTNWYVIRFEPGNVDTVRTGLAIRGIGAATGMLLGLIAGVMCRPKPSTSSLLRGCACGGFTAAVLSMVFLGVVGFFPLAVVGCGASLGGTLVFARQYACVAAFGGTLLMACTGALVGPADGWIIVSVVSHGVLGVIVSLAVLLACYFFALERLRDHPRDAAAVPEEPIRNGGLVTADRFVWCSATVCAGLCLAALATLSVWEARLQAQFGVTYVEDSPKRYLTIRPGVHGVVYIGPATPRRTGKIPRKVNGNLETIFRELYRGRPRYSVESQRPVSYRIQFDPDDSEAPHIVARELGLRILTKTRSMDALVLRLGLEGCRLNRSIPEENPDRYPDGRVRWEINRAMEGISMDQLAEHLEVKHNHPVVNMTGLDGYWTVSRKDQALHRIPGRRNESAPEGKPRTVRRLGDSGIELQWERVSLDVLVVEDHQENRACAEGARH